MRRVLAIVLLLLLPAPVQAQPNISGFTITPSTVDLLGDTETIELKVTAGPADDVVAVDVTLTLDCGEADCPEIFRSLQRTEPDSSDWNATIHVSNDDLVKGDWNGEARAFNEEGEVDTSTSVLTVEVDDSTPPEITVAGKPEEPVPMGSGSNIRLLVKDESLHTVWYKVERFDKWFSLPAPYQVSVERMGQGSQELQIRATDRALLETTLGVDVYVDTEVPGVELTIPDAIHDNVSFQIEVEVEDRSAHAVFLTLNDTLHVSESTTGNRTHTFDLLWNRTGVVPLEVVVRDDLDNVRRITRQLAVGLVEADTYIRSVKVQDEEPLPTQEVTFKIVAGQREGIKALPLNFTFVGPFGHEEKRTHVAGIDEKIDFTYASLFPPGRHTLHVSVHGGPNVTETDDRDQVTSEDFEVFLGRTVGGGGTYYVRAGPDGLPLEAVDTARNRVYDLFVEQRGEGTIYTFVVGEQELYWDPLETTTRITEEGEDDEEKGIPGLGVALLFASVALGGWLRRRRSP